MYYRLTYISSSDKTRIGDSMLNGDRPLNIGEGAAADVQLPESEFEPQIYASILRHEDVDAWYLVRRTDCHKIQVNGRDMAIAQDLNSGDVLSFENAELRFQTFDDGEYDSASGALYKKHRSYRRQYLIVLGLVLLALGISLCAVLKPREIDLRHSGVKQQFGRAVYHITTDSVYLLCDTMIDGRQCRVAIESIELDSVASGTAFLTDDSLFVTARHCIEPWVADEEWDGVSYQAKMSPELRLATRAETANRMAGYEKYTLKAHCVISKDFEVYNFYSTDFCINKSRDMVVKLGTDEQPIYWRTIFPIANRRDMELGDFAYLKATRLDRDVPRSQIKMADWNEIVAFAKSKNHDIAVIGYPLTDNDTDDVSENYGNLMYFECEESQGRATGCLPLTAPINPGNSGGPVFAKIGNEIKVIGIVSKVDGHATQNTFWAVPITEVLDMHRDGDTIVTDSVIYRR